MEVTEQSYRAGYGEIDALKILKKSNIKFYDKKNFNIYFYIIDDTGYFHFPKSRFIEEEGVSFDLFPMIPVQVGIIKSLFGIANYEVDNVYEVFDEANVNEIQSGISELTAESVTAIIKEVEKNPPLKPIHNRVLNVYKSKFQIVELEFKKANLHTAKVKLPKKTLPFKDPELRKAIEATLKIFNDLLKEESMKDFANLKNDYDTLRKNFFVILKKREKSLISSDRKAEFEKELRKLKKEVEKLKKELLNSLQDEINKSRERIRVNMIELLRVSDEKELEGLRAQTREAVIKDMASRMVSSINFPTAKKLLSGLGFSKAYYDITWEDLNDDEVLAELVKKKLISSDEKAYLSSLAIETENDNNKAWL